jgi:hypothetical protein
MTIEKEVLKRINVLLFQIIESVSSGNLDLNYLKISTDEIDSLLDNIK